MARAVTGSLRLVLVTAVVTSLGWIALFALWVLAGEPERGQAGRQVPSPAISPEPVATWEPPADGGRLAMPVAGVEPEALVDTFTQSRAAGARAHDAIDIMAARGTPVLAAAPGRVEKLFLSGEGGNTVYVRSADGTRVYYYAHLDGYAPGLAEGQPVRVGDRLGTVGSTGNARPDGPHLHFAIFATRSEAKWFEPGEVINPFPLLRR
jgi:murein DD-endopeptidase MepM/ murein hydrolase activator NlpD